MSLLGRLTCKGAPGLTLAQADSQVLSPVGVERICGRRPTFISGDGDRSATSVAKVMKLAESSLAEPGIVALDDFSNRQAIGVAGGFFRFMQDGGALAPFAFTQNKLFLARQENHDTYVGAVLEFDEMWPLPGAASFRELKQKSGRHCVVQELCGREVVLI